MWGGGCAVSGAEGWMIHLDTALSEEPLLENTNQLQPHSPTLLSLKLASDI